MHWHAIYLWLDNHGLWEAVIAWTIAFTMGTLVAWIPVRRHLRAQKQLIDAMNAHTPGGLRDIALLLRALTVRVEQLTEENDE